MSQALYSIAYGEGSLSLSLPRRQVLMEMKANPYRPDDRDEEALLCQALENPIDSRPLVQKLKPGERVVIVVSDITRPCPTRKMLPPLLEHLAAAGIPDSDIRIVFALGIHRPHRQSEQRQLVGDEIFRRIRCLDSDPEDLADLGKTSAGTPIQVTRTVAEADRRILLGHIEYHYFAGYSGGAKALMPGVAGRAAIQANHSRMIEPTSRAGEISRNRLRLDLEEAADRIGCDFILNVVLAENKQIVGAFAGDHRSAHRAGCRLLDRMYQVQIPKLADLVIASAGGLPKDINLYQTQKALDHARHAVRPGGIIILAGQCREGYGEAVFQRWLESCDQPSELIRRISRHFELGGHKAAAIAMVVEQAQVWLLSDLPAKTAARTLMRPVQDLQAAADEALRQLPQPSSIILMPHAGSTLPVLQQVNCP